MAIIASTLARIKSDPIGSLGGAERINACFSNVGHIWRDRLLDPANTMAMFVLQVVNGNTAISHLRLLSGICCAVASYCAARARLPVDGVAALVEQWSCDGSKYSDERSRWRGRRVLTLDGTGCTAPDTPRLQGIWPQPSGQKRGCGFPAVKLLALMDLASGMIGHLSVMAINTSEMSQLAGPHGVLKARDVVLGDRAFCSFAHLALLTAMSVDAVFRMHQKQIVDFTPNRPSRGKRGKNSKRRGIPTSIHVRRLGHEDHIVLWTRPEDRPKWMAAAEFAKLPATIEVRELRYAIKTRGMRTRQVTIATTLLDPTRYPKQEIARLYGLRWEQETNFRHLKTTMGMDQLKCQTFEGAIKELMVFTLVYNMVRAVMASAAARQSVDEANRVSFIDALRWLRQQLNTTPVPGVLPDLVVNPKRPGRYAPRVKKRRMKQYDLMKKPRSDYDAPGETPKSPQHPMVDAIKA
jgi:Transposase DDE domain